MSVCHMSAWCWWRTEEGIRSPATRVRDGCKLSGECWKLILGTKEQQVVLAAEPSLQTPTPVFR